MPAINYSHLGGTVVTFPFAGYHQGHRSPGAFHVFRYEESVDPRQVRKQPHRHDFYQLLWLDQGGGTLFDDFRQTPFGGATLAFFAPGRLHAWQHEVEPRGIMIGFTPEFFHSNADTPGFLGRMKFLHDPARALLTLNGPEAEDMSKLFYQLHWEAGITTPGRDDIVRALLTLVLCKARRAFEQDFPALAPQPAVAPQPLERCSGVLTQRFRLALDQHFPKMLKVSDYAALLHVSRTHLNEELLHQTGSTASQLIHERLLLEAKRLLVFSTSLTVAEIAYQLRFQDPSYFGRFFRQRTGMSPGAYRDQQLTLQEKR